MLALLSQVTMVKLCGGRGGGIQCPLLRSLTGPVPSWRGGIWIQLGSSGRAVEGFFQLPGPVMPSEWKLFSSNKSCPRR